MTCYESLHISANIAKQEATLLGPTILRVVASVCTGLKGSLCMEAAGFKGFPLQFGGAAFVVAV